MAQLPDVFKSSEHESEDSFGVLPRGWYEAEIVKTEYNPNSKKTGHFLNAQYRILAPDSYVGRVVFHLMNLDNPNQTAVQIAQRELAAVCKACEVEEVEDSEDLHGIPMGIYLVQDKGSANYEPKNEIKKWCKIADIPEETEESPF